MPRSISARADPIPTECTTTIPMQEDNKKGEIHDNNNDDVIIWRRSNVSSGLQLTAFTIHIIMITNEMNEIATPKRINKDKVKVKLKKYLHIHNETFTVILQEHDRHLLTISLHSRGAKCLMLEGVLATDIISV